MFFRLMLHMLRSKRAAPLSAHDVSRVTFRVMPTDLDVLGHMNNGVYLSIMDIGRIDLMIRCGAWKRLNSRGIYPVVANETITFRKSLQPWQLFTLETRIAGVDERSSYLEQRFVVDGEIFAQAFIRARFLKKRGGFATMPELFEVFDDDFSTVTPAEWLSRWAEDVALPSTRQPAPSDWT